MPFMSTMQRQMMTMSVGLTQFYPLFMPGGITWFVAPSGYTPAAAGLGSTNPWHLPSTGPAPSDSNAGEMPQACLATIAQAHTNCVASRGDTVVLMPGTYTQTATIAWTKSGCRLVSLIPYAATVTGDGVITTLMTLNAVTDMEIAGIRFAQTAAMTTGIGIGTVGAAACNRIRIHHCLFAGGAVAASTALVNGQNQAGNDAYATVIEDNVFINWSAQDINTFGGAAEIRRNTFYLSTAASSTCITLGDQGAAFTRDYCRIRENDFIGASALIARTPVTVAGVEANTQMYMLTGNNYAGFATATAMVTAARHPECVGVNYQGQATTINPRLVTG